MSLRTVHSWLAAASLAGAVLAQETPQEAPALPVRDVTVFKDGHAFVLREAEVRLTDGSVTLDDLPAPVLGTFWPYASGGARVVAAVAGKRRVLEERTALDMRQWLLASVGSRVRLVAGDGRTVEGTLLDVPRPGRAELEATAPPDGTPQIPRPGSIALVQNGDAVVSVPLDTVREATALDGGGRTYHEEVQRNRLTVRVAGEDGAPAASATVGLLYVQKGLRWIPAYKVDLGADGRATLRLEATLVNDLIDLEDATVRLVIGVPKFEFAEMVDPIALQDAAAEVAAAAARRGRDRFLSNALSNALMTQTADFGNMAAAPAAADPTVVGAESAEDLFVFDIEHVSLRKGERMVVPVTEITVGYQDVYVLDVPFTPPQELRQNLQGERIAELARLLAAPKAEHVLRFSNDADVPLTTAPALVLKGGRVLAQGLMTYTPPGATSDVAINTAVDIRVELEEEETGREPNAFVRNGQTFGRVDLSGTVTLKNLKKAAVRLEVRRVVLGVADSASHEGTLRQLGLAEAFAPASRPSWWGWWNWPWWWWQWNGVARFRWDVTLEPAQAIALEATWHYFWH